MRVGVAASVNPSAVRAAARALFAVEVAIVALFGPLSDAVSTATVYPCAVGAATVSFKAVVGSIIALLSRLDNAVAAYVCITDGGAVG